MKRKNGKKVISLRCARCGVVFEKELKEYKRQLNKSPIRRFFCSLKCGSNKSDELSPFREFLNLAKKNAKRKSIEFDLELQFLKELWNKQNGKCQYSKVPMLLFPTKDKRDFKPTSASLDRRNSSEGYTKDNVCFVCLSINYAKNGFGEIEFLEFLKQFLLAYHE